MGLEIMIVADNCAVSPALLHWLEAKGHRVSGTFTTKRAERFLTSSFLWVPDLILAFTDLHFGPVLEFAKANWDRRMSRNYAIRPQMLTIAVNDRLSGEQLTFERAGSRLILVKDPEMLLHEIVRSQNLMAELSIRRPHFIQIHENRVSTTFCSPGERCTALMLAGSEPPVAEVVASDRVRTFISALMTMNGRFRSRSEIREKLETHPLYVSSRFEIPSLASIKTYLNEHCVEVLRSAFTRSMIGFDAGRIIDKELRPGNEAGYRLKVSWEIRHVRHSVCCKSP